MSPLIWEIGLDEEMYNLQSEPTLYLAGLHHDILFQNQRRIEPSNNHVNGVIGDYYT